MSETDKKIIIAIDGYSSSGKSSMARALASAIGYRYVDSGAMYRAVTLWGLRHGLVIDGKVDEDAIVAALPEINIDFLPIAGEGQHTLLDGEDVEREIRSLRVSDNVSQVAVIPAVRHHLVELQQRFGDEKGIVMDGRDIGTTVFPQAEMKVFVDASAETRARRRFLELQEKGVESAYEDVLANVRQRDHIDTTRAESPLVKASDAVSLDNSEMTIAEQNKWLIDLYHRTLDALI
ncbi:(d)CMP kinase [uncultured Muribaculum sp.]|uniref:(d)CMP kinase n=1 Tax=uncultured Muribaculum sp. TaxID=1918613 RepID=UPI0025E7EACA|nr:(d)CMP kinase [uncultured Muribaculum sp.]